MKVGELNETITVSGEAPLVDVTSTTKSAVYDKEVIESLPNNRQIQSLAQTIPGVVGGQNIDGPASRSLSVHGSRIAETNSAIDGMSDRRGSAGGQAVTFYMNEGSVQEVSVRTDGGDAEAQYSGVWMNAIPKEGGNQWNWSIVGLFANKDLSGSNLSQKYIDQGLTAVNGMKRTWDFNPNGGGPIVKDKLWFYGAYRNNQIEKYVADAFYSKDPLSWTYTAGQDAPGGRHAGPSQLRGASDVAGHAAQQDQLQLREGSAHHAAPARRVHRVAGSDHLHAVLSERDHDGRRGACRSTASCCSTPASCATSRTGTSAGRSTRWSTSARSR